FDHIGVLKEQLAPTTFPLLLAQQGAFYINANVIPSRFRAEMTAFRRKKEMTIFFASMAHHFSEHASQVVSRGSVAALIPLEKHATLAHPLRQNLLKSARNFTGADSSSCLHSHPAPRYACGQRSARFVS